MVNFANSAWLRPVTVQSCVKFYVCRILPARLHTVNTWQYSIIQSISQSGYAWVATSRLVVKFRKNAGSDDVRIWLSEEPDVDVENTDIHVDNAAFEASMPSSLWHTTEQYRYCTEQYRYCTEQYRYCTEQYRYCTEQYRYCSSWPTLTDRRDSLVASVLDHRPRGRGFEPSAGRGQSCSNRGPVALCTLGLGLRNPPSFRGR